MLHNSLIEVPRNLKEGIDWLIALKGRNFNYNMTAMGLALHNLLKRHPVGLKVLPALECVKRISKQFLEQPELKDQPFVKNLLRRYEEPLNKEPGVLAEIFGDTPLSDYENVVELRGVKGGDIIKDLGNVVRGCEKFLKNIKIPYQYKSAYSSKATWDESCSRDPEACAVVFVGIAPMLYAGLRSLRDASEHAIKGSNHMAEHRLWYVFKAMGYREQECRPSMSASDMIEALSGVDVNIFTIVYDLAGFWAFY
ncbi:hypothetical protein, conserved [Babesia ovata]|uniref:Uncharacterized protein n=1 Tax=Babesia ovata TaxID=189622 RepID=A0A2H6KEK5_9APIC|nr:uncharacterized protein BOVATA_029230 [Babesia ovata]GBE61430.1 hypothetical protein, conserved [Babesia ovata]